MVEGICIAKTKINTQARQALSLSNNNKDPKRKSKYPNLSKASNGGKLSNWRPHSEMRGCWFSCKIALTGRYTLKSTQRPTLGRKSTEESSLTICMPHWQVRAQPIVTSTRLKRPRRASSDLKNTSSETLCMLSLCHAIRSRETGSSPSSSTSATWTKRRT